MATIRFALKDLADLGLDKEQVQRVVPQLGMDLTEMGDEEVAIDITPNRADMLDINGFARAALLYLGKSRPKENFYVVKNDLLLGVEVGSKVKRVRPFIAAMVVKNVDLNGNRLKNLINFTEKFCDTYGRKRRKVAIGLHNFDVVEGPFRYDAADDKSFVPLGSKKKMSFKEILEEHEKGISYGGIVRNVEGSLPYLSDSKNILGLIPIINSELTRVKNDTKNLLVDITGTSLHSVVEALRLLACSFIDQGAEIYACKVMYPNSKSYLTPDLPYPEVKIRNSRIEKTLGVPLEADKIITLVNMMGYTASKYGEYTLVYVPPYRLDVLNEQDIIEDIAIAYGYDKIAPLPVWGFSSGLLEESKEYLNRLSRLLLGMGYTEMMNMYLTNESVGFEKMLHKFEKDSIVRVAYAKTENISMLRTSILPGLLQSLGGFTNEKMPQRLFETGSVFGVERGKIKESSSICIVSEHSKANFAEIKASVESLLSFMQVKGCTIRELEDPSFIKGRCAAVVAGKETVGYLGEINPQVLQNFNIEEPVVAAEIMLGFKNVVI